MPHLERVGEALHGAAQAAGSSPRTSVPQAGFSSVSLQRDDIGARNPSPTPSSTPLPVSPPPDLHHNNAPGGSSRRALAPLIVVDASVLANAIADDEADGERARSEVRSAGELATPDLVDVEAVAVLRRRRLAGTVTARRFKAAIDDLELLELDRYPTLPLMGRAYELRHNLTAYDASYIALAELLGCELLTGDRRLATAPGPRCPIRILP